MKRLIISATIFLAALSLAHYINAETASTSSSNSPSVSPSASGTSRKEFNQIKDEKKREALQKIDNKINEINGKQVKNFGGMLDRLQKVLDLIKQRIDKAEAKGIDVTDARKAVTDADKAIADTRIAISAQTIKKYDIVVTSDKGAGANAKKTRDQLYKDLKLVQDAVKAARKAVSKAAVSLAKLRPIKNSPSPSPSASPSPSSSSTPTPSASASASPTATPSATATP